MLRLIAAGKSNRQMAAELFLSVRAVERHFTNIYSKISAHNRAGAIAFALSQRQDRRLRHLLRSPRRRRRDDPGRLPGLLQTLTS